MIERGRLSLPFMNVESRCILYLFIVRNILERVRKLKLRNCERPRFGERGNSRLLVRADLNREQCLYYLHCRRRCTHASLFVTFQASALETT